MRELKFPVYKTYSGTDPYAFISYAHGDADRVLPVIGALNGDLFRQWYDGGIEAGTNWPEAVASHLLQAGTVVFFLSARFLNSQNCIREANYAVSERKPMICVFLEPLELPSDLAMQFSTATFVHAESTAPEEVAKTLGSLLGSAYLGDGVTGYGSVHVGPGWNVWRIVSIVFASFFLLTLLFMVGYFSGWFSFLSAKPAIGETSTVQSGQAEATPEATPLEFKDSVTRDILLRNYEEASLYLCGNTMAADPSAIRRVNGAWYVGKSKVQPGNPSVLELVAQKRNIAHLALVDQGIESFDALVSMSKLQYLDISGNPVTDLGFLASLPDLKTLRIVDVGATDYSVLSSLPALETVYVEYASAGAVLDALGDSDVDVVVK